MYKNRAPDGKNNLCGKRIRKFREAMKGGPSQNEFAVMLQNAKLDLDKNAVQRIESGARFVTDIELKVIAQVLGVSYEALLDDEKR